MISDGYRSTSKNEKRGNGKGKGKEKEKKKRRKEEVPHREQAKTAKRRGVQMLRLGMGRSGKDRKGWASLLRKIFSFLFFSFLFFSFLSLFFFFRSQRCALTFVRRRRKEGNSAHSNFGWIWDRSWGRTRLEDDFRLARSWGCLVYWHLCPDQSQSRNRKSALERSQSGIFIYLRRDRERRVFNIVIKKTRKSVSHPLLVNSFEGELVIFGCEVIFPS